MSFTRKHLQNECSEIYLAPNAPPEEIMAALCAQAAIAYRRYAIYAASLTNFVRRTPDCLTHMLRRAGGFYRYNGPDMRLYKALQRDGWQLAGDLESDTFQLKYKGP